MIDDPKPGQPSQPSTPEVQPEIIPPDHQQPTA